jgi:hypothetical protein
MSKVTVNLPGTAKGEEVEVAFLGLFPNGSTTTVTPEQVATWEACTERTWPKDDLTIPDAPVEEEDEEPEAAPKASPTTKGGKA